MQGPIPDQKRLQKEIYENQIKDDLRQNVLGRFTLPQDKSFLNKVLTNRGKGSYKSSNDIDDYIQEVNGFVGRNPGIGFKSLIDCVLIANSPEEQAHAVFTLCIPSQKNFGAFIDQNRTPIVAFQGASILKNEIIKEFEEKIRQRGGGMNEEDLTPFKNQLTDYSSSNARYFDDISQPDDLLEAYLCIMTDNNLSAKIRFTAFRVFNSMGTPEMLSLKKIAASPRITYNSNRFQYVDPSLAPDAIKSKGNIMETLGQKDEEIKSLHEKTTKLQQDILTLQSQAYELQTKVQRLETDSCTKDEQIAKLQSSVAFYIEFNAKLVFELEQRNSTEFKLKEPTGKMAAYNILGLNESDDDEAIQLAYKVLMKKYALDDDNRTDQITTTKRHRIEEAYTKIKTPLERARYAYANKSVYEFLGVSEDAEQEVILAKYRVLSKRNHPDINQEVGAMEIMQLISAAYDEIGTDEKRKKYDLKIGKVSKR